MSGRSFFSRFSFCLSSFLSMYLYQCVYVWRIGYQNSIMDTARHRKPQNQNQFTRLPTPEKMNDFAQSLDSRSIASLKVFYLCPPKVSEIFGREIIQKLNSQLGDTSGSSSWNAMLKVLKLPYPPSIFEKLFGNLPT